jgi:hypothetical protein
MPMTFRQVEKQAFMLTQEQQLQLVHDIMDRQVLTDVEKAQVRVAEQRAQEIDSGQVKTVSSEEAFRIIRSNLKK